MTVRVILWVFSCYFLGDNDDADDSDWFCIHIAFVASFCPENPASKFLQSCVQFRNPIETVQTAVHQRRWGRVGGSYNSGAVGGVTQMGRWMEESKLCVYLGCRRAFLGRRGSGKAPLEDQRHSQQRPEGNKIQRSGRKTSPEQSKKHKKSSSK